MTPIRTRSTGLPSARRGGFNKKQQRQSLDENAPESFRGVFVFWAMKYSARQHDAACRIGGRYGFTTIPAPHGRIATIQVRAVRKVDADLVCCAPGHSGCQRRLTLGGVRGTRLLYRRRTRQATFADGAFRRRSSSAVTTAPRRGRSLAAIASTSTWCGSNLHKPRPGQRHRIWCRHGNG